MISSLNSLPSPNSWNSHYNKIQMHKVMFCLAVVGSSEISWSSTWHRGWLPESIQNQTLLMSFEQPSNYWELLILLYDIWPFLDNRYWSARNKLCTFCYKFFLCFKRFWYMYIFKIIEKKWTLYWVGSPPTLPPLYLIGLPTINEKLENSSQP